MKNVEPKDLLFIDKMITPVFINVVYWVLMAAVVICGIAMMTNNFIGGLFSIIFGLVIVRVSCEVMVVLFKINSGIQHLVDKDTKE